MPPSLYQRVTSAISSSLTKSFGDDRPTLRNRALSRVTALTYCINGQGENWPKVQI
ncbi:hypothetical protein BJY01DRAFT_229246 [Aspergillus pseudoustus]|uniref:Uncharacterized protein n=1 Tax=Aspergillus pseudoustus TaxID=1810923 RepID=A0ABR4IHM7_9EURO